MAYLPTAQAYLEQSRLLISARPSTVRRLPLTRYKRLTPDTDKNINKVYTLETILQAKKLHNRSEIV